MWIAAGKEDIDILATNLYMGGNGTYSSERYKATIDKLLVAFGVDGTYLTEFGPSWTSLANYSTNESVQATSVADMLDYIKSSGIKRAVYFCYYDDSRQFGPTGFGALKTDKETYRELWDSLINSE